MIPPDIKEALAQGDFDPIEAEWLVRASDTPQDLDFFTDVAGVLIDTDETSRARTLLEILDEQLKEQEQWDLRLDLIRAAGRQYLKSGHIYETILETLERSYADRADELTTLMDTVGLNKGRDETTKVWDKVERIRNLFTYRVGTVVYMKEKGVGRIADVNFGLQSLKVDLERIQGLSVGFRAAGTMLELVPEGHFLWRKLEDPEALGELSAPELLGEVLRSHDRALTGAEIKDMVLGVVPESKWSSWWTRARKHPQVVTESGKKQAYRWAETSEHAQDALLESFDQADDRGKLDVLRRSAKQDEELRAQLSATLAERGEQLRNTDPALAFEIWQALDRVGAAPTTWTAEEIVKESAEPRAFLASLPNRALRAQAYQAIQATRDDWPQILSAAFLEETESRALATLAEQLRSAGQKVHQKALEQALSQPRKTPAAFVWVAEQAADQEERLRKKRGVRLLKQILVAQGDEIFAPFKTRLAALSESGSTLPRILAEIDQSAAADAEDAILQATGLPRYQRDPLINAIHLKFPDLRKDDDQPLYSTAAAFEAKRNELKALLEEEIPVNRKAIETAREMGDLRENFEYKAARQRHEYLTARATQLNSQLERARVLEPDKIDSSEVRVGTRVQFRLSEGGEEQSLVILGPWESKPEDGVISHESELAQAILGKAVGETVTLGEGEAEIESISVYEGF